MAQTGPDYYRVLGVQPDADPAAIRSAYRRLVRRYHPDVSRGVASKQKFLKIQEAYAVLSDRVKRRDYDHIPPQSAGAGRAGNSPRSVKRYVVLDALGIRVDAGVSVGTLIPDDE
jgi:molecular chaperone DnaJ